MSRAAGLLLCLLLAAPAAADSLADGYTPPAAPTAPNPAGLLLRLVLLTAGTLLLCGGILWVARRAAQVRTADADGGGRMKHLGSLTLDRRSTVHVISVDGQQVSVTVDATGLRSMVVLSEPFPDALDRELAAEFPPIK